MNAGNKRLYAAIVLMLIALVAVVGGVQASIFYSRFTPRIAEANGLLFDLLVERTQGSLYHTIELQLEALGESAVHGEGVENRLRIAWDEFDDHFSLAPVEALETLRNELPALGAGLRDAADDLARLEGTIARMQEIYSDSFRELSLDLGNGPFYLWPTASILGKNSDYRHAATFNRALYLAQVGEIGTARVLLTGLHASANNPKLLGLANYLLGRLQFELFLSRPEAEFYTQALMYLRESLKADPTSSLAKRFFDYLLSLSQTEAVPREGEGRPTTPADGEGAAVSADKRKF